MRATRTLTRWCVIRDEVESRPTTLYFNKRQTNRPVNRVIQLRVVTSECTRVATSTWIPRRVRPLGVEGSTRVTIYLYQFQRRSTKSLPTTLPACSGWRRPCSRDPGVDSPSRNRRPRAPRTETRRKSECYYRNSGNCRLFGNWLSRRSVCARVARTEGAICGAPARIARNAHISAKSVHLSLRG